MKTTQEETGGNVPAGRRRIAGWKVLRRLGAGGMAEVFEVEDPRLGARAALKLFSHRQDADGQLRARFLAEAALLARLNHPRLVRVRDYGIDPESERPFFAMDLVLDPTGEPRTLADRQFAGADEDCVAMWYEDLRDALAYIHAHGIVHRDIKLQNVLVGPDGHAVLSDFGVAKIFDASLRDAVGLSPDMTLHAADGRRTVMGSLGYLAPELELGAAASPASDYYALGVLVFYLLTGTWCEPRTDIAAELETYGATWRDILPPLLHANPAARACPSWRERDRARREAEAARAEDLLERARRGRRLAVCAALLAGFAALAAASCLLARPPQLQTVDLCPPISASSDPDADEPDLETLLLARGLVCEYVAKINQGAMTRKAAADELRKIVHDDSSEYDDEVKLLLEAAAQKLAPDSGTAAENAR